MQMCSACERPTRYTASAAPPLAWIRLPGTRVSLSTLGGAALYTITTFLRRPQPREPDGPKDGLRVGGGFRHDLGRGAIGLEGDQAHGVERGKGGIQRERQAGAAERLLQGAADDQRQMGDKQMPPHAAGGPMVNW